MRLIDADKLKFPNIAIFDMKLHGVTVPMARLIDLQMLMPTVDAAPVKHGRWIEKEGFDGDSYYTCSSCGCDWTTIDGTPVQNNMRYCPECGAKMDLEENDAQTDQTGK